MDDVWIYIWFVAPLWAALGIVPMIERRLG